MQTLESAINEYLERERAAHASPGKVDLNAIAREVAAKHKTTARDLLDAVIEYDMPGAI